MSADALDTLDDIELDLPGRRAGKVRVGYELPGGRRLFVTTDRLSAFDRVVASVPHKGQVLNQLAAWWFEQTRDIVPNHLLAVPDENVSVVREVDTLPVEVIVRHHITGVTDTSLWTRYATGQRVIDGHRLPDGLVKNDPLPATIITPTTKGAVGAHDEPLSCDEVVERGLVEQNLWRQTMDAALALFERGQQIAGGAGLILADTKYEFGRTPDGALCLIDEIHTPDSSRFWVASTYAERHARGDEPESLDKEVVRRALLDAGAVAADPTSLPTLGRHVLVETSQRYISAFEAITGQRFVGGTTPIADRIRRNVAAFLEREQSS